MPEARRLDVRVNASVGALEMDASFTISAPWTVLFGPSGSGKSSLLRLIAGLWIPNDCAVRLNDEDLREMATHTRRIALVAQQVALFPHRTVRQNVAFGCNDASGCTEWISELIESFHLNALTAAKPATLSGGERQRVAIARALGSRPRYLLLDEVFTGMHTPLRQDLMAMLRGYSERLGMPILSVTHDVAEALQADDVIKIEAGRIVGQGAPKDVLAVEREGIEAELSRVLKPLSRLF